jgi:tRNA(Ile)-lysidine synthase
VIGRPDPSLVDRFAADVAARGPPSDRLGLAVSGGPDSLALLLLAHAALTGRVEAATVDHGLRAESGWEALHVEDICRRLGCPHAILSLADPPGPANLQAEARTARYRALAGWARRRGLAALLTAHHADDQAETVLMRLGRGSGVRGLAGIRPVQSVGGLLVLRPLLGWTKAELVHLVAEAGIEPVDDPSNRDTRFDRAQARAWLRDHPDLPPARLARTAAACREADEALDWAAERLAAERLASDGAGIRLDAHGLPRELRRRLLGRAFSLLIDDAEPRGLDGLLDALDAGEVGTLTGVRAAGGGIWRLELAPPRRVVRA